MISALHKSTRFKTMTTKIDNQHHTFQTNLLAIQGGPLRIKTETNCTCASCYVYFCVMIRQM